jgi:ribosome-associated translation inhibitor RaiA
MSLPQIRDTTYMGKNFNSQISFVYNKKQIFIEKENSNFYNGLDDIAGVIKNKISKTHNKTISKHKKRYNVKNIEDDIMEIEDIDSILEQNYFGFEFN